MPDVRHWPGGACKLLLGMMGLSTSISHGSARSACGATAFVWGSRCISGALVHSQAGWCRARPGIRRRTVTPNAPYKRTLLFMSLDGHKEKIYGMHDTYGAAQLNGTRQLHNDKQASVFDESASFFAGSDATPPEVVPRLQQIVRAGNISESSRVLDVGTGTGVLLKFFEAEGVKLDNVTGVDVSTKMLEVASQRYPQARFWHGDIQEYGQSEEGQARRAYYDAVYFNAMFGNVWDQRRTLEEVGELVARDGRVVISHPLGAGFVEELRQRSPSVVPHPLPTEHQLKDLAHFSRLEVESFRNERELYIAVLRRRSHRPLRRALFLRGEVSQGYGRGSKKLGIPTANLPESLFKDTLKEVPVGVYLGWARVEGAGSTGKACKAVVNVGYSPTFVGKENREKIVEAHLIKPDTTGDFYGHQMRLVLLGFQRRELKFPSFPALVAAIQQDVRDAADALDLELYKWGEAIRLVEGDDAPAECSLWLENRWSRAAAEP